MSPRSSRLSRAARQKLRARGLPVALAVLASLVAVAAWRITPAPGPAVSGPDQPPSAAATHAAAPGTARAGSGSAPGSILWSIQGAEEYRASATIDASGAVYVGNEGGTFRKLDPTTGETQWTFDCCADQPTPELDEERGQECNVDSTAAVDADGDLWVGCWNGTLVQLDADGGEICRHLAQDEVSSSPAIAADGTVYVGSEDRMLWAVSGEDCSVLWQQHFPDGSVYGAPLVAPTGMVACGPCAADNGTDTWDGVAVFFQDPDETPDIEDLEQDAQGDGGDSNPGGQGDDGDGGFDVRFEGTVENRVAGTATNTCTSTATMARVGPQAVKGTVAYTFAGELASGGPVDGSPQGDAGGDGTMTVQLSADPFNTFLQSIFDDEGVWLTGSDSVRGGESAGNFAVPVGAARVE